MVLRGMLGEIYRELPKTDFARQLHRRGSLNGSPFSSEDQLLASLADAGDSPQG